MDLTKLIDTPSSSGVEPADRHNVLFATSEVAPFAKTGSLGDVAASLPKALCDRGHRVSLFAPLYGHLDPADLHLGRRLTTLEVPRKSKHQSKVEATIWEGRISEDVRIFFVQADDHFGGDGVLEYGAGDADPDACDRYAFFSRAIVEFVRQFDIPFDVVHCHDWHTALAPVYRSHYFADSLDDTSFVLTIHNLAYQGEFDAETFEQTGLPRKFDDADELLHDGSLNFLKGGIKYADRINTVSPTYAEEIRTESGGEGLHAELDARGDELTGILNGVDYSVWSPDHDKFIPVRYDREGLNGKRRNKAELQHRFGLAIRPMIPLVSFVGRLSEQKGLDILLPAIEELLEGIDDPKDGFQVLFLGEGDSKYEDKIRELADTHDRWVGAHLGYHESLAHLYQAGSDMLLAPSKSEPCGLTQLYAMRYGTLPIAHKTGGLADTVVDVDSGDPDSTGFVFDDFDVRPLRQTIERALNRYTNYRQWRPLMERAMKQDFSWGRSADAYADLYDEATGREVRSEAAE